MSRASRREYFQAVYVRYQRPDRKGKQGMLKEFCANTGYHRKYALRLLNGPRQVAPRHHSKVIIPRTEAL